MSDNPTPGLMPVTQADRDAAAEFWLRHYGKSWDRWKEVGDELRSGQSDDHHLVQLLARHRTQGGKQSSHTAGEGVAHEEAMAICHTGLGLSYEEVILGYFTLRGWQQPHLVEFPPLEEIRAQMKRRKLTARDVARELGVSEARVSQMLSDKSNLTLRTVQRLFKAVSRAPHQERMA